MKIKYINILVVPFLVIGECRGQDAYKWKDSSGRTIYGNKAPQSSSNVESFETRELSTYNSSKALSRMGTEEVKKSMPEETTRDIGGAGELELTTNDVEVSKNDEGQIVSVKVKVINNSEKDALDVSVAFKFADGQLVPAEGPFEIKAKGEAEYQIPKELLPVELKAGTKDEPPKAITHGLAL